MTLEIEERARAGLGAGGRQGGDDRELTPSQRRIWASAQVGIDDLVGRQTLAVQWPVLPEDARLRRLVEGLMGRHPGLATAYTIHAGGRVESRTRARGEVPLGSIAVRSERQSDEAIAALDGRPFDLCREGALQAWVLRGPGEQGRLVLRIHPIVCDGRSLEIIARDLVALWAGQDLPSSPASVRAGADVTHLPQAVTQARLAYWRDKFDEEPPACLPTRMPDPDVEGRLAQPFRIAAPTARRLLALGDATGADVPTAVLAALGVMLMRYSARSHLRAGLVLDAGEDGAPDERAGWHETILPILATVPRNASFEAVLAAVTRARREALEHLLPIEVVARAVWEEGDSLVRSLPVLVEHRGVMPAGPDLVTRAMGASRRDAELVVTTRACLDGSIDGWFGAAADLFDQDLLARAVHSFEHLLDRLTVDPSSAVGDIPLVTPEELDRLSAPYPEDVAYDDRPVHEWIAAAARRAPDEVAVIYKDTAITKAALEQQAQRLAHMVSGFRLPPETRVAVAIKRSPDAMAAILAVMKAGCAFVPIDTDHPPERNDHIVADAAIGLVLTMRATRDRLPAGIKVPIVAIDDAEALESLPLVDLPARIDADQLAYVIYTSGSTGKPKGVAVEHGPLSRHCQSTAALYEMTAQSRELPVLPFSSDGGHERWMVPLMVGGSIVLPDRLWTPAETFEVIRRHGVNNASLPTTYVQQLAEHAARTGDAPPMRLYSFGGEGLPQAVFDLLSDSLNAPLLINGYGPTETIMTPMIWKVRAGARFEGLYAPIGRAVGQRRVYVLDEAMQPVPVGVLGEIYLGGDGLARGYQNQPAATADRFVPDPFAPEGGRLYRSGDLGVWRPDGTIAFMGRADHQVKLRGFRIELGEIERALLDQPGVAEAVVLMREDGASKTLVGYVTPRQGAALDGRALRRAVAGRLPDYMVPAAIVVLPQFPLNANSKVDRKRLPAPELVSEALEPLDGKLEELIGGLWRTVLDLPAVGATQNFFDLGGHSILALRILAGLREALPGTSLGIADLFNYPTVRELAQRLGSGVGMGGHETVRLQSGSADRPMLYCFPGLIVSTREYLALVRHLGPEQPATGFICYTLADDKQPDMSVENVTARYAEEIRRASAGRPVAFLGWSWGGLLAYEAARLLGEEIDLRLIGMLDVCDMDESFALGAEPVFAAGERERIHARVQDWLGRTRMREAWQTVLGRMDRLAYDQFLRHVSDKELHLDGPEIGSSEHIFWVLIDNALVFRRYAKRPFDVPIASWIAGDSITRGLNIIDWRRYSPRATAAELIPGTTHFDIVGSPSFHRLFARRLAIATESG